MAEFSDGLLEAELRAHFSDAWISGYESLVSRMANNEKDRHVAAAALRHFRPEHLEPWGIAALHPQSFLIGIFRQEEGLVLTKLEQPAADRGRSLRQLLEILIASVPDFVALVSGAISRK